MNKRELVKAAIAHQDITALSREIQTDVPYENLCALIDAARAAQNSL